MKTLDGLDETLAHRVVELWAQDAAAVNDTRRHPDGELCHDCAARQGGTAVIGGLRFAYDSSATPPHARPKIPLLSASTARIGYVVLGILHVVIGVIAISSRAPVAAGGRPGRRDGADPQTPPGRASCCGPSSLGLLGPGGVADRRSVPRAQPRHEEEVGLPHQVRRHGGRVHRASPSPRSSTPSAASPTRPSRRSRFSAQLHGHSRRGVPGRLRRPRSSPRSASRSSCAASPARSRRTSTLPAPARARRQGIVTFGVVGYVAKGIADRRRPGFSSSSPRSQHDPDNAGGLDAALHALAELPFGSDHPVDRRRRADPSTASSASPAHATPDVTMPQITGSDGVRLNYLESGDPCGRPVVLVAGFKAPATSWKPPARRRSRRPGTASSRSTVAGTAPRRSGPTARTRWIATAPTSATRSSELGCTTSPSSASRWAATRSGRCSRRRRRGGIRDIVIVDQTPKMLNSDDWAYGFYDYDDANVDTLFATGIPIPAVTRRLEGPRCASRACSRRWTSRRRRRLHGGRARAAERPREARLARRRSRPHAFPCSSSPGARASSGRASTRPQRHPSPRWATSAVIEKDGHATNIEQPKAFDELLGQFLAAERAR